MLLENTENEQKEARNTADEGILKWPSPDYFYRFNLYSK